MIRWLIPIVVTGITHGVVLALPIHFDASEKPTPAVQLRFVASPESTTAPPKTVSQPTHRLRSTPTSIPKKPRKTSTPKPAKQPALAKTSPEPNQDPQPQQQLNNDDIPPVQPTPAGARVTTPAPAPPTVAPMFDRRGYGKKLHRAVLRQRRYPKAAKSARLQGRALVTIIVGRTGHLLGHPILKKSSGHALLDAEALRMARAAAPFPPLPMGYTKNSLPITIPIRFVLRER